MLAQSRAHGADVAEQKQEMERIGRFRRITDPGATGWNCGSPDDRVFKQAVTC